MIELIANEETDDPLSPECIDRYFSLFNSRGQRDEHRIGDLLKARVTNNQLSISFRTAAKAFRLIDDNGVSIVVPFSTDHDTPSPIHDWLSQLEADGSQKWIYRHLQRFTISVSESVFEKLQALNYFDVVAGLFVLKEGYYDERWGMHMPDDLFTSEKTVL